MSNTRENWFKLTLLAYVNLWAQVAVVLPRPWEQYLKTNESVKITPSLVQRDFGFPYRSLVQRDFLLTRLPQAIVPCLKVSLSFKKNKMVLFFLKA